MQNFLHSKPEKLLSVAIWDVKALEKKNNNKKETG